MQQCVPACRRPTCCRLVSSWTTTAARPTDATSLFLSLVEPSIDGLGRVVAACELSHRECARRAGHSGRPSLAEHAAERANLPCDTIWSWFWAIDAELSVDTELPSRLGDELECWQDPAQAAGFIAGADYLLGTAERVFSDADALLDEWREKLFGAEGLLTEQHAQASQRKGKKAH